MANNYEELEKIAELKDKGIITEEEFNKKKSEILRMDTKEQKSSHQISKKVEKNDNNSQPSDSYLEKLKHDLNDHRIKKIEKDKKDRICILVELDKYKTDIKFVIKEINKKNNGIDIKLNPISLWSFSKTSWPFVTQIISIIGVLFISYYFGLVLIIIAIVGHIEKKKWEDKILSALQTE